LTHGQQEYAHYICNALDQDIKTIGIDNIIQIYTNNISSMKSLIDLFICHFPSFYYQGYIIHCLDLLLEDGEKTSWAK
jgi:hypothetical protein